ncbi:MAG: GNAT family N-acetyltransferase [Rhodomicrobium sp.]
MSVVKKVAVDSPFSLREQTPPGGTLAVVDRAGLTNVPAWRNAFQSKRKDKRYYELVEDTLCPEFTFRYVLIQDENGRTRAVQPFFLLDQDVLAGLGPRWLALAAKVRRFWPRFLMLRTLMVGCAAGEAHLQSGTAAAQRRDAETLAANAVRMARREKAALVVLKEFPAEYRSALSCFLDRGFTRIPSMPMTRLNIAYASFDDYVAKALRGRTRGRLRKKFSESEQLGPIELQIVTDASAAVDEIYPLYEQVYEKSTMHFEKLTKSYFREIGRRMPDKVRFFLWRLNGKIVAFSLCLMEGTTIYPEYIGLDYSVAIRLHLYFVATRDVIEWAIGHGFTSFVSSGLGYAPKLQMRHVLEPLDLYVRHTSPLVNAILKRVLPWLEPTRRDAVLKQFPNYRELWEPPR